MADELEMRVVEQVLDVVLGAGEEVVDAEHVVAALQQPLAQMRAEEAGAAGDEGAFSQGVGHLIIVLLLIRPYIYFRKSFFLKAQTVRPGNEARKVEGFHGSRGPRDNGSRCRTNGSLGRLDQSAYSKGAIRA